MDLLGPEGLKVLGHLSGGHPLRLLPRPVEATQSVQALRLLTQAFGLKQHEHRKTGQIFARLSAEFLLAVSSRRPWPRARLPC